MVSYRRRNSFYLLLCVGGITIFAACSPKITATKSDAVRPAAVVAGNSALLVVVKPVKFNPHAVSDSIYTDKTDSLLNLVKQQQPAMLFDSTGKAAIPSEWVGSVNFGIRKANYVIIHFTAQDSIAQTLKTFTIKSTEVSSHYVIAKDGKIFHLVNDYLRANHAGVGKWGSVADMNSISLGIELDNNGTEPFIDAQIKSLLFLLDRLKTTYNIPTANFIGHQDFAPKRKPDPGPLFPWKLLADHGFGYWSDAVLDTAPQNFDYATALRLMGYDISDLNAAIIAFKRHFVQDDSTAQLSQLDMNVLYNVYQKY